MLFYRPHLFRVPFCKYKWTFSIVLMAIVSIEYCFVMLDIGAYGSKGDGGILNATSFNRKSIRGLKDLPAPSTLPRDNDGFAIPYVFVGDESFHCEKTYCNLFHNYVDRNQWVLKIFTITDCAGQEEWKRIHLAFILSDGEYTNADSFCHLRWLTL